jgi:hypothetical protein
MLRETQKQIFTFEATIEVSEQKTYFSFFISLAKK